MPDYLAMNRSGRSIVGDSAQPCPEGFVWVPCPLGEACADLGDGDARQQVEDNHYHEPVSIETIVRAPGPTHEQWRAMFS